MCHQFVEVTEKLKRKMMTYKDKLKAFLILTLRQVPFLMKLKEDLLEELTFNLKQRYIDKDSIIFRAGEKVDNLYFITRGEVNLSFKMEGKEFILHNLYQGCYMGGHKML
jgi:CRP-like cAMP-binding protein